jgi:hypothetical protein
MLEFFKYGVLLKPGLLHPDVIPPASRFDAYWLVLVGAGLKERPDKVVLDGQLL